MTASVSSLRPTPRDGEPAPDGFHYEVAEDGDWQTPAVGAGRCRYMIGGKACGRPAEGTLHRSLHVRGETRKVPWDYCADHLYGRWLENGKVMTWRLVKNT